MIRTYDDSTHLAVPKHPVKQEPVAWMIKFRDPKNPDWLCVHYHGTNAIADYRQIDPQATVTELFSTTPDQSAKIAELESTKDGYVSIVASQAERIIELTEKLRIALEAGQRFLDSHEECTDFDGFLAQTVSMDDYHEAQEALSALKEGE